MRIRDYTPKEFAYEQAISGLVSAYKNTRGELDDLTPAQTREAKRAIAKLHNKLLDNSRLNGIGLAEDVK